VLCGGAFEGGQDEHSISAIHPEQSYLLPSSPKDWLAEGHLRISLRMSWTPST